MSLQGTKGKDKFDEQTLNTEFSQQIVIEKESALSRQSKENSNLKQLFNTAFSNLLVFSGVYLLYAGSLTFFQIFIADLAEISNPQIPFLAILAGFVLTFAGTRKLKEPRDFLLYLSVPLISFILAFLFTLAPENWHGKLFGIYSLIFFLPVLHTFYHLKENFFTDSNDLD